MALAQNKQSAHGLCITICTLTHRPHCISFPSTLSLAHSLVLSVWSCCVLLFILDLLVLLSSSSLSSSSSPSGPGIEKNSPNHQYHHPDSRSSNPPIHYPPPTTHRPPSHSHTSHLTPHTANHKPASSPQLRSLPRKSSPESPNPGPDPGALCALRTASPSLTRLEARDTRRAPAWAAWYHHPVLELRISSLRSALCDVYVSASGLDPGPYPSSNETLGKHSTIYPRSGLSTGLLELQLLAHLLHPRAASQKRKRTRTQRSRLRLRLLCIHLLPLPLLLLLWLCIPCTVRS